MKSKYITVACLSVATAFDVSMQPTCAVPCLKDAITKVNCTFDLQCVCPQDTQDAIKKEAMGCIFDSCQASDVVKAQKAAAKACATFTLLVDGTKTQPAASASSVSPASSSITVSGGSLASLAGALLAAIMF